MKEKKGVSPLIAWVLLIGLSVSIGFLVINWAVQNIPEPEPELSFCDDVSLFLINSDNSEAGKVSLEIKNNGLFTINKFTFGVIDPIGYENAQCFIEDNILPGDSKPLEIGLEDSYDVPSCPPNGDGEYGLAKEVYLVPWIRPLEGEDAINCNDKKLIIEFET